jgi:ribose/xylose/arabinose/galactoside ABC-type transport system permease subunit
MSAIIDSAPSCIANVAGAKPADDSADFILQAAYEKCAGIMTFGPGSTYGDEGASAATSYYVVTWIGIIFMIVVLVAWVLFENRRLVRHVARLRGANRGANRAADIVE